MHILTAHDVVSTVFKGISTGQFKGQRQHEVPVPEFRPSGGVTAGHSLTSRPSTKGNNSDAQRN